MKTLIVDDELLARARISRLLSTYPEFSLVAQACDGEEALVQINKFNPDLVFLDVDMPGLTGLQIAEHINQLAVPPAIVFLTAHPEYALDALQLSAAGYLVKPATEQSLSQVLEKIGRLNRAHVQKQQGVYISYQLAGVNKRIALQEILFFTAEDKYTKLVYANGEALIEQSLKQLQQRHPTHLLRVHRHTLINTHQLQSLQYEEGQHFVKLKNYEAPLLVSRRALKQVKAAL